MDYDFQGRSPAVKPGSLILVTGISGLIGGHVANKLLAAGYNVKGTTRNASNAQWASDLFNAEYGQGRFEVVELASTGDTEEYSSIMQGVSGVIHIASDTSMNPNPHMIIPDLLDQTRAILGAASKTATIERFVLTSSSTAMNDEAVKDAYAPPPYDASRRWSVYSASKALVEREAWKWVSEHKPRFGFDSVLPNANFGVKLDPKQTGSTTNWVLAPYVMGSLERLRSINPQYFVDVEDDAAIHVAALIDPDVRDERLLAFAEPFTWTQIVGILRHLSPEKGGKISLDGFENEQRDFTEVPNQRAEEILKRWKGKTGWTRIEDSIKKSLDQYERWTKENPAYELI